MAMQNMHTDHCGEYTNIHEYGIHREKTRGNTRECLGVI